MKNARALLGLMLAFATSQEHAVHPSLPKADPEELKRAEELKNSQRGLAPFKYGEHTIWALNKKNADRKAKLKKLTQ